MRGCICEVRWQNESSKEGTSAETFEWSFHKVRSQIHYELRNMKAGDWEMGADVYISKTCGTASQQQTANASKHPERIEAATGSL